MTLQLPSPFVVTTDDQGHDHLDPWAVQRNFDQLKAQFPVGPRIIGGGQFNLATSQNTNSAAYTTLGTPDLVTAPVATNGLIVVGYQALWQNSVASSAKAAIFIGANQMKGGIGTGAPTVQEIAGPAEANDDALLFTSFRGLQRDAGVGNSTEVTTGQFIGTNSFADGGPTWIFNLPAGTYDFSVQFKTAAGTVAAKNRHLYVISIAFS